MKGRKGIASGDELPEEKWLVAFLNPSSKKTQGGAAFMRQFYASGYYEAYDKVFTHAEKMSLEVLWFREKRNCEQYLNHDFPELEAICIYCNKKFNHVEPVPCSIDECTAEFCSKECMSGHQAVRHKIRVQ